MTATRTPARVASRLNRLEAAATVRHAVGPHEAARRWTERFQKVHPHIIHRIMARGTHDAGLKTHDGRLPNAGLMWCSLMYQLPHLWDEPGLPPSPPEVPDPEVAEALLVEFLRAAATFQADHRDVFPMDGYGLQGVGLSEIQLRRAEREAREAEAAAATSRATDCGLTGSTEKTPTEAGVGEGA